MVPVCSILIIDSKKMVKRNKHKTENLTCETKHMTRDTARLSSSGAMKTLLTRRTRTTARIQSRDVHSSVDCVLCQEHKYVTLNKMSRKRSWLSLTSELIFLSTLNNWNPQSIIYNQFHDFKWYTSLVYGMIYMI